MTEIKEYLESLLDDFNSNIIDLQEELNEINVLLKEDTKFLELLKNENDEHFSEFSPRNVNYKNEEKIKELEESINTKTEEKNNLETYIEQVQEKIDELDLMIGKIEIYEIENNITSVGEQIVNEETIINQSSDSDNDMNHIKNKLATILSFLPSDPMRAKIELSNLYNSL